MEMNKTRLVELQREIKEVLSLIDWAVGSMDGVDVLGKDIRDKEVPQLETVNKLLVNVTSHLGMGLC